SCWQVAECVRCAFYKRNPSLLSARQRLGSAECKGRRSPPLTSGLPYFSLELDPSVGVMERQGTSVVVTTTLLLYSELMYSRIADPGVGPSTVSVSPSRVTGPTPSSVVPNKNFVAAVDSNVPFLPITVVVKLPSMTSIRCS